MAQTLRNTVVNRHENLHYVKFDGVSKPVLAGTGLTDWTQAVDPSTDDGQYINEKTSHSNMMAYTPSVSYSGELIPGNEIQVRVHRQALNLFASGIQFEEKYQNENAELKSKNWFPCFRNKNKLRI